MVDIGRTVVDDLLYLRLGGLKTSVVISRSWAPLSGSPRDNRHAPLYPALRVDVLAWFDPPRYGVEVNSGVEFEQARAVVDVRVECNVGRGRCLR